MISCLHLLPLLRRCRPTSCCLRPASCLCFWTLSSTCQTSPRTFSWVTQKLELCRPCRLQNAVFRLQTSMISKRELKRTSQVNSLTAHWLGLWALTAEDLGLRVGRGNKIPQVTQCGQNINRETDRWNYPGPSSPTRGSLGFCSSIQAG